MTSRMDVAMKRKITDLVPRQVALDYRCAMFADASIILLSVYTTTDNDVIFEVANAGIGEFGVSFQVPSREYDHITISKANSAWGSSGLVKRLVAKCIVALSAYVRRRYPWVKTSPYGNTATFNPTYDRGDIRSLKQKTDNEIKDVFAGDLYRVKYYESLGFQFDGSTYQDMLNSMLEELRAGDYDDGFEDDVEYSFNGDLLAMADGIIKTYPECVLTRLDVGLGR